MVRKYYNLLGIATSVKVLEILDEKRFNAYFTEKPIEEVAKYNQKIKHTKKVANNWCEGILAIESSGFVKNWVLDMQSRIQSFTIGGS